MRHKVTFLRPVKVKDGSGYVISWETLAAEVPAEVVSLAGREGVIEKVFQGVRYFRIMLHYRDDLLPDDQIRYGTLDLNIRSAEDEDGRRQTTVILADTESALVTS
ncbi:hypothetical protein BH10PSE14_BH10PSE14_04390 [soil metagenome]